MAKSELIADDTIYMINPATGLKGKEYFMAPLTDGVERDFLLLSLGESRSQFILAISSASLAKGEPLAVYPPEQFTPEFLEGESIYFTHVDKKNGLLNGFKLRKDLVAIKVWSLNLEKSGESIIKLETQIQTSSQIDHLHFTPTAFSGENIIYKHLDSNIFALLTSSKSDNSEVSVYLVNGVSGRILHKYVERKVRLDLPFDIVLSENIFVFSFQRQIPSTGLSHQELTVTELYSARQEDNTKKLLVEYYTRAEERLLQKQFSSFTQDQPVVVQESYILPFTVKSLALTQTIHHITNKNLIVINNNNQVYQIEHNLFSARRPHPENLALAAAQVEDPKKTAEAHLLSSSDLKSKELPPYDAVIPVNPTKHLSYGTPLIGLNEIKAFPTRLESTTQVLVYGFDIFYTRMSPESNFDLVQEYFNYTLLFLFIAGLALATYLVRAHYTKGKKHNAFLMM